MSDRDVCTPMEVDTDTEMAQSGADSKPASSGQGCGSRSRGRKSGDRQVMGKSPSFSSNPSDPRVKKAMRNLKDGRDQNPQRKQDKTCESDSDTTNHDTKTSPKTSPSKARQRQTLLQFTPAGLGTRKPLKNPTSHTSPSRVPLRDIARETKNLLPGLLATRPDLPTKGYICKPPDIQTLNPKYCPNLGPTTIRVIDNDTIDAALSLIPNAPNNRNPLILNMANATSAGGGWLNGALAQEEALCYRTSLSFTLKRKYYPLPDLGGIYSPFVMVIRENMTSGHDLLDFTNPKDLPAIAAVSIAAVCLPQTRIDPQGIERYLMAQDKRMMEDKMRVILRIATRNGHRQIVLGAFGCGAFRNPRGEVARMWLRVLGEREFAGGWWRDVVFAVLDDGKGKAGNGNFMTFRGVLDGVVIK